MPIDNNTISASKRAVPKPAVLMQLASQNGSLYYEVMMLVAAARVWEEAGKIIQGGGQIPISVVVAQNTAIESFLVHYRILRDFLYPPQDSWTDQKRFDDVIAWDFSNGWLGVRSDWKECSLKEQTRINKLLAHISYSRADLDREWPRGKMIGAIRGALDDLVDTLPLDRRNWFNDLRQLL